MSRSSRHPQDETHVRPYGPKEYGFTEQATISRKCTPAAEGKSVEVNLGVARGNITLAGQIAIAWSAQGSGGA
jgi:hypothetical protein